MPLDTRPNLADPDTFYQCLIGSQRDMTDEEAQAMNCRLVLLLANHIGDPSVLREAIGRAGGKID